MASDLVAMTTGSAKAEAIGTLLQRAESEWELLDEEDLTDINEHNLPEERFEPAAALERAELHDAANITLAKLRLGGALEELVDQRIITPEQLVDLATGPAGATQVPGKNFELNIRILPENDPNNLYMPDAEGGAVATGDARLNEPINRFVAVTFRGEDPVQGGLIVNPPSLDCPPDLYVYRLDFGDGFNSSGSANLRLNDLIGLLGDNPFLEAIGSVADDYEAEFSYAFGMNGGLIAGYDTRTADLEDFFYIDTRGVLPFAQWVEGQPSDLWGFDTAQDGYDPGFAEALLRLDAGLDRLQRPDRFKLNGKLFLKAGSVKTAMNLFSR